MAITRPRRLSRYKYLINHHLLHSEATEFSIVRRMTPWLHRLIEERGYEWEAFQLERKERGWGIVKSKRAWRKQIEHIYNGLPKGWAVRDLKGNPIPRKISPWDLKQWIFDRLPEDEKWDSPRNRSGSSSKTFSVAGLRRGRRK